jgi:hypothetical protein
MPRDWSMPDTVVGPKSDAIVDAQGNVLPEYQPFVAWLATRPEAQARSIAEAFQAGLVPANVQVWHDRWLRETGPR